MTQSFCFPRGIRVSALCMALLPMSGWAIESVDRPNLPELARPDYLPSQPDNLFKLPPVSLPPAAIPQNSVGGQLLRRVVFRGNSVMGNEDLERVVAPWFGKTVTAADLESLRIELSRAYIERGYVNSGALIGPEGLKDEILTIDIVEGRLSSLQIAGLDGLDEQYLVAKLVPEPDAPLHLDSLRERYLLLLDDPLIKRMNARLMPDARLGEAILGIEVEQARPWHARFQLNNHRPASTGELALGIAGGYRNLTGRGDALEASLQRPFENEGKLRGSIGWRVPLNYYGTQLSLEMDQGQSSVVEEPLRSIGVTSELKRQELGISHRLHESLNHRLAIGLDYMTRHSRTWLGGVPFAFTPGEPSSGTRVKTWRFWQEYTGRSEQDVLALRSTFTNASNNIEVLAPQLVTSRPDDHYRMWLGQLQYARRLTEEGTQFIVRASTQVTSQHVLSMDGLAIGGVTTVRGYRENQLIRDRGHVLNLELDIPILRIPAADFSLNVAPFIDYGAGRNQTGTTDKLSSAGIALHSRWGQFALDLVLARPLSYSRNVTLAHGTLQDKGVHFQLSYNLGGK